MKKIVNILLCTLIIVSVFTPSAAAQTPYQNYTYDFTGWPLREPQAFTPTGELNGIDLGIGKLSGPMDIYITPSDEKLIADTGNNRIIILDKNNGVKQVISGFVSNKGNDTFNQPSGVFVALNGDIYIADTENARIVVLDQAGKFIKEIGKPKTTMIADNFSYRPLKVAVDSAYRIFVVAKDESNGIIELASDGNFQSFFGAINVALDIGQIFWRTIATKEQLERMTLAIPTEYFSIDIDTNDFIFGVVNLAGNKNLNKMNMVRRLNPIGNDILVRQGTFNPIGDLWYYTDHSQNKTYDSQFIDVASLDNGIYSVLDSQMGRIFTYDSTGDLLYIFGGKGDKFGLFSSPEALDTTSDGKYYVVDSKYNQVVVFSPTDYAKLVNEAVTLQTNRQYDQAEEKWAQIMEFTSMSDLAYIGKGKALLRKGDYEQAMKYFKLGNNRILHGKAFAGYRKQILNKYFGTIMTSVLLISVFILAMVIYKKRGKKSNER